MVDPGITAIRIVKGTTIFHVHGELAGAEGVYLAKGQVHGLYEAPVQTTWKSGVFDIGSRMRHRKWLHRDLTLGFHIKETFTEYELNESLFRQIFEYEEDMWDTNWTPTTIEVETDLSGVRKLDVLMFEAPDFDPDLDPISQQYGNYIFKLRAGQPFWYEDDVTTSFTNSAASAYGTVSAANPTDQTMLHKWVLTRGTWTLPDFEWVGAKGARAPGGPNADRTIDDIIVSEVNGGAVVDLDPAELMFRDANDTNILGQLAGKFFMYAIPPYTPATDLSVSYTDAPTGGAMVQLVQPIRWSRPWGLELPPSGGTAHVPLKTIIPGVGPYTYVIPSWCDTIDVILLAGGGGGSAGGINFGDGGDAGGFATATLVRGTDIPWDTLVITGEIGNGGVAGAVGWPGSAGNGGDTTATATGMTPLTATGGTAVGQLPNLGGQGAGSETLNGRTYTGSSIAGAPGEPGHIPGGGGAGGWPISPGGAGARGQAWFYAYQTGPGAGIVAPTSATLHLTGGG